MAYKEGWYVLQTPAGLSVQNYRGRPGEYDAWYVMGSECPERLGAGEVVLAGPFTEGQVAEAMLAFLDTHGRLAVQ